MAHVIHSNSIYIPTCIFRHFKLHLETYLIQVQADMSFILLHKFDSGILLKLWKQEPVRNADAKPAQSPKGVTHIL